MIAMKIPHPVVLDINPSSEEMLRGNEACFALVSYTNSMGIKMRHIIKDKTVRKILVYIDILREKFPDLRFNFYVGTKDMSTFKAWDDCN